MRSAFCCNKSRPWCHAALCSRSRHGSIATRRCGRGDGRRIGCDCRHICRGQGRCGHGDAAARLCVTGVRGRHPASLQHRLPGLAITPSAAIWPQRREYERCLVALMNAYVEPMMTDYLAKLSQRIRRLGIDAPVYISSNNGSTLSIDGATAADRHDPVGAGFRCRCGGCCLSHAVPRPHNGRYGRHQCGHVGGAGAGAGADHAHHRRELTDHRTRCVGDRDRRRRRLSSLGGRTGTAEGWPAQCGRAAGPGLLRRRRHRGNDHRCYVVVAGYRQRPQRHPSADRPAHRG